MGTASWPQGSPPQPTMDGRSNAARSRSAWGLLVTAAVAERRPRSGRRIASGVARLLDVAADDVTVDRQGSVDRVEQKQGVDDQAEALQPARRGDHRRPAAAVAGEKKHPGVGMVATLGRNVIKNLAGMDEGVVAENPQATVVEQLDWSRWPDRPNYPRD